jgi:putative acyl-CoA dehydrogenase
MGTLNGLRLQRLKDKLGNRSNASSEVEFSDTYGFLLGGEGEGIRTILDMVTLTRLDCALASAGMMRASLAEAVHHCRHRQGVRRVADRAALDGPGAGRSGARCGRRHGAVAETGARPSTMPATIPPKRRLRGSLRRRSNIGSARQRHRSSAEAMESLGRQWLCRGPRILARHYREAPVNAIWEGSGNIMALDVCSGFSPVAASCAMWRWTASTPISERAGPRTVDVLRACMAVAERDEGAGRLLSEQLALAAAAAELTRLGAGHVAEAFVETRLGGAWRATYGMLDARFRRATDRGIALSACKLSGGPQSTAGIVRNEAAVCKRRHCGIERRVAAHLPRQQIAVHRRGHGGAQHKDRQCLALEPESERQARS